MRPPNPPPHTHTPSLHVVLSAELGVLPSCVTAKSWSGGQGAATCPLCALQGLMASSPECRGGKGGVFARPRAPHLQPIP